MICRCRHKQRDALAPYSRCLRAEHSVRLMRSTARAPMAISAWSKTDWVHLHRRKEKKIFSLTAGCSAISLIFDVTQLLLQWGLGRPYILAGCPCIEWVRWWGRSMPCRCQKSTHRDKSDNTTGTETEFWVYKIQDRWHFLWKQQNAQIFCSLPTVIMRWTYFLSICACRL